MSDASRDSGMKKIIPKKDLKALGQIARISLQQEKSKRKEIVLLDDLPAVPPTLTSGKKRPHDNISDQIESHRKDTQSRSHSSELIKHESDQNRFRSKIVRLVGLPWEITNPSHVNYFFKGFSTISIFILPFYECYTDDQNVIYCEFESHRIAEAACARSGETINIQNQLHCVQVSLCEEPVSADNLRVLGPSKSTFHSSWTFLQKTLPPAVIPLLVNHQRKYEQYNSNDCHIKDVQFGIPRDTTQYKKLIQVYNKTCDKLISCQEVLDDIPFLATKQESHDGNLIISYQNATQWIQIAESILEKKLKKMKCQLLKTWNSKKFRRHKIISK